jgi:ATP-dependent RNA helicase DeaD
MESGTPAVGFESFALSPELQAVVKELGYEEPTPIQRETIPPLLAGRDVLGIAATGTGKTAAFSLPLVERLDRSAREPFFTRALVLVPTRELAMQVAEAIRAYGRCRKLVVTAVFGGQEIFHQLKDLKHGVDVVVATPGRALDHLRRKSLKLGQVRFVVLDEADEMLDMGFAEDLETIFAQLPPNRQTALFSATLPARIATIAAQHLEDPVKVTIAPRAVDAGSLPKIRQAAYLVRRDLKESALIRLLDVEAPTSALIFCRTRLEVEALTNSLTRRSLAAQALHGGMTQEQRDLVLRRFKKGDLKFLIATDVAARGLHVENLSHVINYDLPVSPEPYVHRIGRTGRAGREGVALSLLDPRELRLLKNIERVTRTKIPLEPVPGADQLRKKREGVLSGLLKAALVPRTVEHQKALLAELTKDHSLEEVASAALAVALDRLFPPTEGDDSDFAPQQRVPFRGTDDRSARAVRDDRDQPRASAPRARASVPRQRAGERTSGHAPLDAAERKPFNAAERKPFNAGERKPFNTAERKPFHTAERKPFNTAEREPLNAAERKPFNAGERKPFNPERKPFNAAERKPFNAGAPSARPATGAPQRKTGPSRPERPRRGIEDGVKLFISLGSKVGLRPEDLVGAIANEAGVSSRDIGEIEINEETSRVVVPKDLSTQVVAALKATTLRGRKFSVDLERQRPARPQWVDKKRS